MKKFIWGFVFCAFLTLPFLVLSAPSLAERLKGKILLQVESNGEAWYIYPDDLQRYYLGRPADAFNVMRSLGLGISNKDFDSFGDYAPKRLSGKILLKVEDSGKAYYVNPSDLKMHYLGKPIDAFNVMKTIGIGITNHNLSEISISGKSGMPNNSNNDSQQNKTTIYSIDTDKDGITDKEEDKIGTNKYKADTDGDMVDDKYDEHPLEVGAKINKVFKLYDHYKNEHSLNVSIPLDYYLYYKNHKDHDMGTNYSKITQFVTPYDPIIISIIQGIRELNEQQRLKSLADKGFQDINYQIIDDIEQIVAHNFYSGDKYTGYDEYPKYPIETIVEGSGDCEDLSFLTASLMVYDVETTNFISSEVLKRTGNTPTIALLRLPGHVAVGKSFNDDNWHNDIDELHYKLEGEYMRYYSYNGKKFIFIETTNPDIRAGHLPEQFRGQSAYIYELN